MPLKSDPTYTLNFLQSFNDAIIDLQVDIKKQKLKKVNLTTNRVGEITTNIESKLRLGRIF